MEGSKMGDLVQSVLPKSIYELSDKVGHSS